ncbi:MAG: uroporphyrinogen decarboxylase family protein [Anaerolineales bacterium]|nr:uroporphyrinogen decarboxylase family protein [Anaerolineales bacterium]HEY61827.1 uroporphyrinogen decarboxylase [Anaerolineae bacterium]
MNLEKWEIIKKSAHGEETSSVPVSLIVDSPWIPGYVGVSTIDYLTIPDVWLDANLRVQGDFPDVIFLPGFWVEMGMAAEPSGFGCKIKFFDDKTPNVYPRFTSIDVVDHLKPPNPRNDGLMPLILSFYHHVEPRLNDQGFHIKVVAARGPFATAGHVMGISEFLLSLKLDPNRAHRLIEITTQLTIDWLQAQADVLHEVDGIMVLDDIIGFVSPQDYLEFAHPYFQKIFNAFPNVVKMFHNDMDNMASYPYIHEWSVDIFNFTHLFDIAKVREQVGSQVTLMGNVPPLDVLFKGTEQQVIESAKSCLDAFPDKRRIILSAGGGVSPDTPAKNIQALVDAVVP